MSELASLELRTVVRKNELEERMLLNLSKKRWTDGLTIMDFEKHASANEKLVSELKSLSEKYIKVWREVKGFWCCEGGSESLGSD